jgi:hypothetical protein
VEAWGGLVAATGYDTDFITNLSFQFAKKQLLIENITVYTRSICTLATPASAAFEVGTASRRDLIGSACRPSGSRRLLIVLDQSVIARAVRFFRQR